MAAKKRDSLAMLEDDIRHLKAKKLLAEEKSAYWLMRANEIDEKISRVVEEVSAWDAESA